MRLESRFALIGELVGPDAGSVLDVGCRDRALESHLPPGVAYTGLDLFPPADVLASAEEPLPFEDDSFDAVVFADVLEHLNDPHGALDEGMRVARSAVVVVLPNIFSAWHRVQFLRGRMSGKYAFGPEPVLDRHRWVVSYGEAVAFTAARAEKAGWKPTVERAFDGGFTRRLARGVYGALRLVSGPDLWAWAYAARLEPVSAE